MEGRLLLDVVVGKSTAIFKLLSGENQSLLVGWNTLLILNLSFDIFNRIARLYFQSDCLSSKGFDENLHIQRSLFFVEAKFSSLLIA